MTVYPYWVLRAKNKNGSSIYLQNQQRKKVTMTPELAHRFDFTPNSWHTRHNGDEYGYKPVLRLQADIG